MAISDLDKNSLSWAMRSHDEFPPVHGKGSLTSSVGDLRKVVLAHGRHWVDIDPFGSLFRFWTFRYSLLPEVESSKLALRIPPL